MLISPKNTVPYIAVFKMPSAEEFIAKVVKEDAQSYTVTKPMTLAMGENGVGFVPLMIMAKDDSEIVITKPVITSPAATNFESSYEAANSSLLLPKKANIITA